MDMNEEERHRLAMEDAETETRETLEAGSEILDRIKREADMALDIETHGPDPENAPMVRMMTADGEVLEVDMPPAHGKSEDLPYTMGVDLGVGESRTVATVSAKDASDVKDVLTPWILDIDYFEVETKLLAGLVVEAQTKNDPSLKEAARRMFEDMKIEDLYEQLIAQSGTIDVVVEKEPKAEDVGHRTFVESQLEKVPTRILKLIEDWAEMSEHNRAARRKKAAVARKIRKYVPKTITLVEAAAVV